MTDRANASSNSAFETAFGFSRATRIGSRILVAGTAPVEPDGTSTKGDAAAQAERCFAIILDAIAELGGSASDVVRTRMYIVDAADAEAIGTVHARLFRDIRPVATMVVVAGLLFPDWRVEIEAEANLDASA